MKLNKLEFMLMNNAVRAVIQEKYEAKILRAMSSLKGADVALEIGCGNGHGTKIIQKYFSPKKIFAIDLDEKMIAMAQRRTPDPSVTYQVMDASRLDFPDHSFDAIFDFGIIHHIPNWKDCIQELRRVLKPDGEVLLEDLSIDSFSKGIGKVWQKILDHPYPTMYSHRQFTAFLAETGFEIRHYKESNPLGLLKFFSLTAILQG